MAQGLHRAASHRQYSPRYLSPVRPGYSPYCPMARPGATGKCKPCLISEEGSPWADRPVTTRTPLPTGQPELPNESRKTGDLKSAVSRRNRARFASEGAPSCARRSRPQRPATQAKTPSREASGPCSSRLDPRRRAKKPSAPGLRKHVQGRGLGDGDCAFALLDARLAGGAVVHATFTEENLQVGGPRQHALDQGFGKRIFDVLL